MEILKETVCDLGTAEFTIICESGNIVFLFKSTSSSPPVVTVFTKGEAIKAFFKSVVIS
jgi:hypothetical protein